MQFKNTRDFAGSCDLKDPLKEFRRQFHFPIINGREAIYFCGNSLGLEPVITRQYVEQELEDWKNLGVEGHMHARKPWFPYHEFLRASASGLTGALPEEVVVMNSLTVNLHLMMVSFYQPDANRYKILFEQGPFSSDRYAFATQAQFHANRGGKQLFDPGDALLELKTREGEYFHRTEDIIETIQANASQLALVLIGGVNYYTGQLFDMEAITKAAHEAGAKVGFDLAHAIGNVKLNLHDWDVDFAAWCSYKYLNGGPGAVGGAFIHNRYADDFLRPRFGGWWGNDPQTRFEMHPEFIPRKGADGWQLSNAPVLSMAALRASMELFDQAGIDNLVAKSRDLTGYLEFIINDVNRVAAGENPVKIITPSDARGCQLSIVIGKNGKMVHEYLSSRGVISDWRNPDVIRVAPVPLYNSFMDVYEFGQLLAEAVIQNSTATI